MYGMSPLGVVDKEQRLGYTCKGPGNHQNAERHTTMILNRHRAVLAKMSEETFEKETVSAAELISYLNVPGRPLWKWRKPPARRSRIETRI